MPSVPNQDKYQGNSYLTPPKQGVTQSFMTSPGAKPVNAAGNISRDMWRYMNNLTAAPAGETAITLGASPATFQATANGNVLISGGAVTAMQLTRNATYTLSITTPAYVPLSNGDVLTVTYAATPTLVWFPR